MSAPPTASYAIGSVLDALPMTGNARDDQQHSHFDALLRSPPPGPPASERDSPRSATHNDAPAESSAPSPQLNRSTPPGEESSHDPTQKQQATHVDGTATESSSDGSVPHDGVTPSDDDPLAESLAALAAALIAPSTNAVAVVVSATGEQPATTEPSGLEAANVATPAAVLAAAIVESPVPVLPTSPVDDAIANVAVVEQEAALAAQTSSDELLIEQATAVVADDTFEADGTAGEADAASTSESALAADLPPEFGDRREQRDSHGDSPAPTATLDPTKDSPAGLASTIDDNRPVPSPSAASSGGSEKSTAAAVNSAISGSATHSPTARLPAELLTSSSGRADRHATLEVDTARLLGRVARAFTAAQQRDGEIRLRLSPPELGSLRLEIVMNDGALVARMETETSAARSVLIENLPALRERLADQGVRIERFDVDLMQRQGSGTPDRPSQEQRDASPPPRSTPVARIRTQPTAEHRSSLPAGPAGRLNVIV